MRIAILTAIKTSSVFVFAIMASLVFAEPAFAKRVALVIGNGAYSHAPRLANPINDATDMAQKLRGLEFDVVERVNQTRSQNVEALRVFLSKLEGAEVALFYYAGHGLQVDGRNFIMPVDAKLATEDDVAFEMVAIDTVLEAMERKSKTNLLFLDACRDNPLAKNLASTMGTRSASVGRGLAQVGSSGLGTLISYSTQPGNIALDGDGRNSPFTAALLKRLGQPGKGISQSLVEVRRDVLQATGGKQVPWENSSLTGDVVLTASVPVVAGTDAKTVTSRPTAEATAMNDTAQATIEAAPAAQGTFDISKLDSLDPQAAQAAAEQFKPKVRSADEVEAALGLRVEDIKRIQVALSSIGYDLGGADGKLGPRSREALRSFQRSKRTPDTGYLNEDTLAKIIKTFEETPKTYDGDWTVLIRREWLIDDRNSDVERGDRELLARLNFTYQNQAFVLKDYKLETAKPPAPFEDFEVKLVSGNRLMLNGLVSTHFLDTNITTPRLKELRSTLKLPKFLAPLRPLYSSGNRIDDHLRFSVEVYRVR